MKIDQYMFAGRPIDIAVIEIGDCKLEVVPYPGYVRVRHAGNRYQGLNFDHGKGKAFAAVLMKAATLISKM